MIIELHQDFEALESPDDWAAFRIAINNLLEAHRTRRHLLVMSRKVASYIEKLDFLGEAQRRTATQIRERYNEYRNYSNLVGWGVVACPPGTVVPMTQQRKRLPANISLFNDDATLNECLLLVENAKNDGGIFDLLFSAHGKFYRINSEYWKYTLVNCGGTGFDYQIDRAVVEKSIFYCIVDSDKRSPYTPAKQTAKQVEQEMLRHRPHCESWACGYTVLDVHELENLIPLEMLEKIWANSPERVHSLSQARKLVPNWPNCAGEEATYYQFFDTKRGIDLNAIEPFHSPEERQYFERLRQKVGCSRLPRLSESVAVDILKILKENPRIKAEAQRHLPSYLERSPFIVQIDQLFISTIRLSARNMFKLY